MIEVEAPDGAIIEFPDGTPPEVMSAAMKKYLGQSADPAAEPTPAAPKPSGINRASGALDAALQGATFGFSDEMIAGTRAALESGVNLVRGKDAGLSENYDKALAYERERLKSFGDENPILSTGASIAGGLAPVGPAIAAVKGASSLGGAVARSAGVGAGYGALGGFGAGEGGLENRAAGAAAGGVVGAGLGAALPVAGAAVGRGVDVAKNILGAKDPRAVALDRLNRGLSRDRVTPDEVASRLAGSEKPLSIMDVAGDSTRRAAGVVKMTPGEGANDMTKFLHERQVGMADRVSDDIGKNISGDDFYKSLEELDSVRRTQAAPLYEEAYAAPIKWDRKVETLLNRPSTRKALDRAYRLAEEEGRDPRGLGLVDDGNGAVYLDDTVASMQTLDYVKRGLDDVLESYRDAVTGKLKSDEQVRSIVSTRGDLLKTLDEMNPAYAQARKAWGGPTQAMEAMRLGRKFAKGDPETSIDRFKKLSEGDQDAFRIGVARELAGIVQNTKDGHNSADRIFGSQGQRNRLRQLFSSDDEFQSFSKAMDEERLMSQSKNKVLGNSQSMERAADQQDAGVIGDAAMDFANGGLRGAAWGFVRRGANRVASGMGEKPAAELAQMLATADKETQQKVLKELVRRQQAQAAKGNRSSALMTGTSAGGANLIGQELGAGVQ